MVLLVQRSYYLNQTPSACFPQLGCIAKQMALLPWDRKASIIYIMYVLIAESECHDFLSELVQTASHTYKD